MLARYLRLTLNALVEQVKKTTDPYTRLSEGVLDTSILVDDRLRLNIDAYFAPKCP
jgi:hypothetical protein